MPTVEHDPDINAGAYARAGEAFWSAGRDICGELIRMEFNQVLSKKVTQLFCSPLKLAQQLCHLHETALHNHK